MKNDPPKLKILVTGAAGLVASRAIPYLKARYNLRLTDTQSGEVAGLPVEPGDLRSPDDMARLTAGLDGVAHFAIAPYRQYANADDNPAYHRACIEINALGSYNLFTAACAAGVRRFAYVSSLTVIMGHDLKNGLSDTLPDNPRNVYACTKLFGENLGEHYARKYGATFVSLRLGDPYPRPEKNAADYARAKTQPGFLPIYVTYRDIAQAVDCALRYDRRPYAEYSIISDNGSDWLDLSKYPELGYKPGPIEPLPAAGAANS